MFDIRCQVGPAVPRQMDMKIYQAEDQQFPRCVNLPDCSPIFTLTRKDIQDFFVGDSDIPGSMPQIKTIVGLCIFCQQVRNFLFASFRNFPLKTKKPCPWLKKPQAWHGGSHKVNSSYFFHEFPLLHDHDKLLPILEYLDIFQRIPVHK